MELFSLDTIEIAGVVLNIAYLILLIKRSVYCWPMGILGSGLSIFIFLNSQLYSEAILFFFYVLIGIYGWVKWAGNSDSSNQIQPIRWKVMQHISAISIGILTTLGLGYFFSSQTDASRPFEDALSTGFAFVASFLEARRVLTGWFYWIAINGFSIWLYADRGLILYSGLSVVYTAMSFYGYYSWRKAMIATSSFSDTQILDEPGF
ncbi:MAG: nicotinamide riboside transporter PnuC [Bacteroidetes bacterium]|uniref:Nicotinamide riboside transporter PnuC n=1 Tax=Phaeocystidibacter marisrubri TaxID=1577780 RepID=A0A6L3ZIQ0_9FLAO|nr:nicotinamide riboside transporter PnuC [Phaeocystidibacter marisrubri]KAB2817707.1 nicotinamide mononucleotide transporter [Phaeocystidibacter marisrubri]TNE29252.1 MAG: nicotinamide riboside transporter PnuC [Bacteroidota bacterium]GGH73995.1 hypothetical protein GCM10011318_19510 [Phaeocystidibacter marisrubri]